MDYREKIMHGDESFPVAVYEIHPAHIRYRMLVHWHPEHEILYVRTGHLHLRLNDVTYELNEGDVVFIPGGTIHSGEPVDCRYTCVLFNLSLLMKKSDACMDFAERIRTGRLYIPPLNGETAACFAAMCREMSEVYSQKQAGYLFEMKSLIFSFFGKLLNLGLCEQEKADKTADTSGRMKAAIVYMEKNFDTQVRLSELAAEVNMSPNHFCRCFKRVTGVTPLAYLIGFRLSRAQYALRNTNLPVTTVALDNGFNDVSHFIRLFRETYGMTPRQYRNAETE